MSILHYNDNMLSKDFPPIFKLFFPQRIAVKLALVISLLSMTLILIFGMMLYQVAEDILRKSVKNDHQEIAIQAASEVSLFINRPLELLSTSAKLIGRTGIEAWDQETVLVELSLQFPMFEEIISVDAEGKEVATSNPGNSIKSLSHEKAFQEALTGRDYVSEIYIAEDHFPHFTISSPIRRMGKVSGVLIGRVNLREMWKIVDGIQIGKTGRAFLTSKDGLLLSHPDKKLVLQNINMKSFPAFRQIAMDQVQSIEFQEHNQKTFLLSYAPIQKPIPLGMIIQMQTREAYFLLSQMKIMTVFLLIVALSLSTIVSFFLARWLVHPIKALQTWSKKVAWGDFDFRIKPTSSDELGRLFIVFRRMSEKLKMARENERLAALGEAAATISHKLKNSIVSLKTFAQLLPYRKRDELFMQRFETNFSYTVDHLEKMFKNLSQIASSRQPQIETIDLRVILQSVLDSYEETMARADIRYRFETEVDTALVQGDLDQLKEVIVNLVQNALHAMSNGGNLILRISMELNDPFLKVSVVDSGIGIRKEVLERIFKPFYTTKHGGMGLGLAICKKVIEEHGGTLSVESKEHEGTTFALRLPCDVKKILIRPPLSHFSQETSVTLK